MNKKVDCAKYNQKGQALILILLVMSVVMTVVLSAVSRSVTEVSVSSFEEDSLRAFSAAEAGIEEKLLNPVVAGPVTQTIDTSTKYTVEVVKPSYANSQYVYPDKLSPGQTATFWLVDHDSNGNLSCKSSDDCYEGANIDFCWGNSTYPTSANPAIEIMLYYDETKKSVLSATNTTNDFSNLKVMRIAQDSTSAGRGGFIVNTSPPMTCGNENFPGQNFLRKTDISIPSTCGSNPSERRGCAIMLIARVYYGSPDYPQPIAIRNTGGPLVRIPSQGVQISSTGVAGESSRKLDVFRSYPEPSDVFSLAVYSGNDITK